MQEALGSGRGVSFTPHLCQVQPGSAMFASLTWGKGQNW